MVPDAEFSSYYGRPVVKPAPWGHEVAAYLFLGGVAAGSGLLAAGGQLTGRATLRRNARLERAGRGHAERRGAGRRPRPARTVRQHAAHDQADLADEPRLLDPQRVQRGDGRGRRGRDRPDDAASASRWGRCGRCCGRSRGPRGLGAALFAPPLAVYTAVLLADTATPTWNAAHEDLPFVFVSSASLAASGLAMITTPVAGDRPGTTPRGARRGRGSGGDEGHGAPDGPGGRRAAAPRRPGTLLQWSERLAVAGGLGTLLGGHRRGVAVMSGLALLAASALTRFGVFEAGLESARDPRYTIEPQKRRLAARRAAGITDDSITTGQ